MPKVPTKTAEKKPSGLRLLFTDYDRAADVLYVSVGRARPTIGENKGNGIIVRYPLDDPKNACGVTISEFKALGWVDEVGKLSVAIASLLSVEREQVLAKLDLLLRRIANEADKPADKSNALADKLAAAAQILSS